MMLESVVVIVTLVQGLAGLDNHGDRSQEENYQREVQELPAGTINRALILQEATNISVLAHKSLSQTGGLAPNIPSKVAYDSPPGRGVYYNDVVLNKEAENSLNYLQHSHKQRSNKSEAAEVVETVVGTSEAREPALDNTVLRREGEAREPALDNTVLRREGEAPEPALDNTVLRREGEAPEPALDNTVLRREGEAPEPALDNTVLRREGEAREPALDNTVLRREGEAREPALDNTVLRREGEAREPALDNTVLRREGEAREPALDNKVLHSGVEGRASGSFPHVKVAIDGRFARDHFHHFWRSTGLCIEKGIPRYNFSQLDRLLDHLHHYQLRPGFELMGNPGGLFTNLENHTQVVWWRRLVAHTATRYIGRYGLPWVTSWLWETWNEPDHHDFDNLNFTVQGFLNYYDACRAGLEDVSPRLVMGGPGGSCRDPGFSTLCWALLQHCHNGSSIFNPASPPTIDYISFHKKGCGEAESILTQELETASIIRTNYPSLRHLPLINDEGDFLKGWWRREEWRADSRYAALVARAVYVHHQARAALPHLLYSFDNAFLNYRPSFFDQRTMVARSGLVSSTAGIVN
ncbi:uncharacterized protein [Procambarus clarkii]|uniref:uncharacterized protein isoform X2 n=1 Tax=Procambarus clarkii TaxID=6728 RepID=UPI0037433F84